MAFKFTSNRSAVRKRTVTFVDMVLGHMSMAIEVGLKTTSGMPVDKGQMKAATRHFKNRQGQWRVEIDKEYAAVQEAGRRMSGPGAPTKPFQNYTTSGTSAGFFMRGVMAVIRNKASYVNEAREALR